MRWFKRSVVLCLLALVLTPARADAWFEWLDYLSGPGPWYGFKTDLRVWCSGPAVPWKGLRREVDQAIANTLDPTKRLTVGGDWDTVLEKVKTSNRTFPIVDPVRFDDEVDRVKGLIQTSLAIQPGRVGQSNQASQSDQASQPIQGAVALDAVRIAEVLRAAEDVQKALDRLDRGAASIASVGIFLSACKNDRERAVSVEIGFTSLQALSNPDYADDHSIRMNNINVGLSYRFPLPPDRDIVDIGTNVGMYHFSSRGFKSFSGVIVEPVFIDLHGPTRLIDAGGLKQLGALFTLRLSLVMFPGGFNRSQFAADASKPGHISGREATPSATVFFNLTPLLWHRPAPTAARPLAGVR